MSYNSKTALDPIDWKILRELQQNARISYSALSRKVSLSRPAVVERIRKLEDAAIISGYSAKINLKALGYPISAYLKVSIRLPYYKKVLKEIQAVPEVIECYRLAGDDDLIVKIVSCSVEYIAKVIDDLLEKYADCNFITFIIMEDLSDFDLIRLQL